MPARSPRRWFALAARLCLAVTSAGSFAAPLAAQSPAGGEVPLPAGEGWRAWRIHRSDAGVWYAHVDKAVPAYAAPEVVVTDDEGRHVVLTVYSGKWTAHACTPD